jgi:PAS domain S-box-containing protein
MNAVTLQESLLLPGLRQFADTSPVILWITDEHGHCVFLSQRWIESTGQSEAEALGFGWLKAVHPEDRPLVEQAFSTANRQRETFSIDYRLRQKDGRFRWTNDSGNPRYGESGEFLGFVGGVIDIHERRLAREELQSSESRFKSVLGLMPAGLYTVEATTGAITYFNDHAARIWGRAPRLNDSEERFCGSYKVYLPDGRFVPRDETPMAIALREGRSFRNTEAIVERPDGSRVTVLVNIDPLYDDQGRIVGAINVFHDVTDRRLAEQALREREEQLRTIVEATPECVKIVAADGTLLQMNSSGLAMVCAHDPAMVVGHNIYEVIAPEDRERFREFNERICSGARGTLQFDIVNLKGERRHMDTHAVPMRQPDGSVAQLAITRDVTRQHDAAIALAQSEERYRLVVESQSEMVCRFRPDGEILFVNGAYARSRGRTAAEMTGQNFWDFIPPADHGEVRNMLALLTPGSPEARVENRFETQEGTRWTLWTNRALAFDAAGRPTEVQSTGMDISDRRRAEEVLREADRRKDEFLAILSHELRNPLAPISNFVSLLRTRGDDPKVLKDALPVLERQVGHLVRLVDDLLDVARINRGDVVLQKRIVTMGEIVMAAAEISRPLIEARGHDLVIDLAARDTTLSGDPVRLAQVLANVLNNAATYTPPGGRIDLRADVENGVAAFRVRDNGPGISPETARTMFELFIRGENTRNHPAGFGIGLALARRLVEMHDGTIDAVSAAQGSGSEFIIRLPLHRVHRAPSARAGIETCPKGIEGRTILVVDDNLDAAESLALLLKALGAEAQVAGDGAQALEIFARREPDVVLLDIGMPGMDGYEVAREIRSRHPASPVMLVALTGWGQEKDRRRAVEAGFDHHLVKPAEIEALEKILAGRS